MPESALAKKLLLKPNHGAAVLNAPQGYIEQLGVKGAGTEVKGASGESLDFIQLFVKNARELQESVPAIKQALKKDGLLWVCYPKGSAEVKTDLNRDILWKAMGEFGLVGVSLVSVDNVWSAMRFRPSDKAGK